MYEHFDQNLWHWLNSRRSCCLRCTAAAMFTMYDRLVRGFACQAAWRCLRERCPLEKACHKRNVVDCFDFSAVQAFLNDAKAWVRGSNIRARTLIPEPKSTRAEVQKALGVPVGLSWRPCNMQVDSECLSKANPEC